MAAHDAGICCWIVAANLLHSPLEDCEETTGAAQVVVDGVVVPGVVGCVGSMMRTNAV